MSDQNKKVSARKTAIIEKRCNKIGFDINIHLKKVNIFYFVMFDEQNIQSIFHSSDSMSKKIVIVDKHHLNF